MWYHAVINLAGNVICFVGGIKASEYNKTSKLDELDGFIYLIKSLCLASEIYLSIINSVFGNILIFSIFSIVL